MRHGHGYRKLGRTSAHRSALLKNLAIAIIKSEKIETTLPKAKELRRIAEPLITLAKKSSLANRRLAFNRTRHRGVVLKLFKDLGPRFAPRQGGYIRILKYGYRQGDNASLALVQLMDLATNDPQKKSSTKEKETVLNKNMGGNQSTERAAITETEVDLIAAKSKKTDTPVQKEKNVDKIDGKQPSVKSESAVDQINAVNSEEKRID